MEWDEKEQRRRDRKRKRFPDKVIVMEVLAPSWRKRVQFDVDGYAEKAQGRLKDCLGWDVESVEDLCKEQGWIARRKVLEVAV